MFMLSGAGSCLTSALASCAAVFACEACKCVAGSITRTSARACYVLYFAMSITVAWIMRDYAQPLMKKIPWIMHTLSSALKKGIYAAASGSSVLSYGDGAYDFGFGGADSHDAAAAAAASDEWLGKQAVYRVTCGTAVFFGVMAVLTAGVSFRNDPRDKTVQHGAWGLKTLLYIICLATPFFFPTTMIAGYGKKMKSSYFSNKIRFTQVSSNKLKCFCFCFWRLIVTQFGLREYVEASSLSFKWSFFLNSHRHGMIVG